MNKNSNILAAAKRIAGNLLWAIRHPRLALMAWRAERAAEAEVSRRRAALPIGFDPVNAQSWPAVSGTTTGFEVDGGVTTIRWGSDGLLQSPKPASGFYCVLRFDEKELLENIKLPNGTGITSTRVRLIDGVQFAITVRDDTQMTPPAGGDTVVMTDAGGIVSGYASGAAKVYNCTVVENDYQTALKQPGERVLVVEALKLIEGTTAGTPV